MGKNLKGKELGSGLSQRKDGKYSARYVDRFGKRHESYFVNIKDARNWLADEKYKDRHGGYEKILELSPDLTVDEWFEFWTTHLLTHLAYNTMRNYKERYKHNIKPVIGHMKMISVRPMHCRIVLNNMNDSYAGSTIRQTYIAMGSMFKSAVMNDVIPKHPMNGVRYTKPLRAKDDIHFLTIEEQTKFMEVAKRSHNYNQYALLLETGLRTGEMVGLTWDAIDWEKRTLTVNKTLEYRHSSGCWRAGPPKTESSYRTIPLTNRAYEILQEVRLTVPHRKQDDGLNQRLEYFDRRTGQAKVLCMKDLVFINYRTGMPAKNSSYDTHLYKLCDEAGIEHFCMHALRHTYATRAIECGMQPKTLQKLLGHASIKTTMDKYVHVTDDSMSKAVLMFESSMKAKVG